MNAAVAGCVWLGGDYGSFICSSVSLSKILARTHGVPTMPLCHTDALPQELGDALAYQPLFNDLKLLDLKHARQVGAAALGR